MAPDSQVETFAALRLEIDSWRWQGVPFYIRAGKCLPVTCTEVVVRLRQPPTMLPGSATSRRTTCASASAPRSYGRLRHDTSMAPDDEIGIGQSVELTGQPPAGRRRMDAYERVLGDAMAGDATLFAREDYVEEAWRIVDPVLKAARRSTSTSRGTWGPHGGRRRIAPPGRVAATRRAARGRPHDASTTPVKAPAWRRTGERTKALEPLGALPRGAGVGHGARGLQRRRRRLGLLPARPCALAGLPLERGRPRRASATGTSTCASPWRCGTAATRSSRSGCSA